MCSRNQFGSDFSERRGRAPSLAWKLQAALPPAVALATLTCGLLYLLGPTDIERAEADLQKARGVVVALDAESKACLTDAKGHKVRAAEHRKLLAEHPDTPDVEWLEWHRAMADGHFRLYRAKEARRDNLLHLAAEYLRLTAEAECEILRAKDARDRGTPHQVAPRVRDLLVPVISGR